MIVYVEWVILDNFALDLLLAYLSLVILKEKPKIWRVSFSAVVGTALVFPFLFIKPDWARILYKIAVLIAVCLPLVNSLKLLRKVLVVYGLLSASFGGIYYLITDTSFRLKYGVITTSGGKVALLAASILIGLYLIRQLKGLVKEVQKKKYRVKIQLVNGDHYAFVRGFYDSGNTVLAPNGKGVIFLSPKVKSALGELQSISDIEVGTVLGKNRFRVYQIEYVKIYSEGKVNTINKVNVAYSRDNLLGCDALLPFNL